MTIKAVFFDLGGVLLRTEYQAPRQHLYLLTTGHFVVPAPFWDNGAAADAGAITWCNGVTGCTGAISSTNSLIGTTTNDQLGSLGIVILNNGNYVVPSPGWDNGLVVDVGAITYGAGHAGTTVGPITASNSVLGAAASGGSLLGYTYDPVNEQLIVSQRTSNLISLFRPTYTSMATGNWSQGQNWDYGAFTQSVDVRITGAHTITLVAMTKVVRTVGDALHVTFQENYASGRWRLVLNLQ